MTMDITYCDSPIDVMYLIHNALRAEATEVTHRARQLGTANTLAAFAQALHQWASTLEEHARIEDTYMTPLLPARPVIQDNEAEHQRLTALFRALASPLQAIPPQMPLTPRLQRQVLGHVITLGVEHDDHLEREEDLVLPLVRQRLSEAQQCALVWRLLCAGGSQEAGTIGPWIMAALTTAEQQVLATLLARWEALQPLVPAPCSGALEELPPASLRGSAQVGAPAVGAMSQIM
jgi:hemerythrin-like domain-containing protein